MAKHRAGRAPDTTQRALGFDRVPFPASPAAAGADRYEREAGTRYYGDVPLGDFLTSQDLQWIVRMKEWLSRLDYTAFLSPCAPVGRKPIHPQIILGLILYGYMTGRRSLRALELAAALDRGAEFLCGGRIPDHSTICRFMLAHEQALTEHFFESITAELFKELKLKPGVCAIDGTVIESAASHRTLLRAEAVKDLANEARREASENPANTALQEKAEAAARLESIVDERVAKREAERKDPETVTVAPSDPEAVTQPRKDGLMRPAYKPSNMVHVSGLVTAQTVEPSSEPAAVEPLLDQSQRVTQTSPTALLMDNGYEHGDVLQKCVERDINVLVAPGGDPAKRQQGPKMYGGVFDKSEFRYDAALDAYHCPAGRLVQFRQIQHDRGRELRRYQGRECDGCPLRSQCIRGQENRRNIRRYAGDELKSEMARLRTHPEAKRLLSQRQWIVEPSFARLKGRQGLSRFLRRGRARVAVEYALHCVAHNILMAAALLARSASSLLGLLLHLLAAGLPIFRPLLLSGSPYHLLPHRSSWAPTTLGAQAPEAS